MRGDGRHGNPSIFLGYFSSKDGQTVAQFRAEDVLMQKP